MTRQYKQKISKCYKCNHINLLGGRTCSLCGDKNSRLWSEGFYLSEIGTDNQRLIIRRNQTAYTNFYNREKKELEYIPYHKIPLYIRVVFESTIGQYQTPKYILMDEDNILSKDRIRLEFSTKHQLKHFILKEIYWESMLHEVVMYRIERLRKLGKIERINQKGIFDKVLKKLLTYIQFVEIRDKVIIYVAPLIIGELEIALINKRIDQDGYKSAMDVLNQVNDVYSRTELGEKAIQEGTEELIESIMKLNGKRVDII